MGESNAERAAGLLDDHVKSMIHAGTPDYVLLQDRIAAALDEAEQRGAEREREACAATVEGDAYLARDDAWIGARFAAAIRARGKGASREA